MKYVWEAAEWPRLSWDEKQVLGPLAAVRYEQGRLFGKMEALGFALRNEASLQTLTRDVVKTSEIEGERLDEAQVRSSIARRLGIDIGALIPSDRNVEGIVEVMLDATRNYRRPLTAERLFEWHAALFPTNHSGFARIRTGAWRDDSSGPMQVVSGRIGRERVHYTAPPAQRLNDEMAAFLDWFEEGQGEEPVLKAGLAHFWLVTIHPFDDGNGRIARAVADMALARAEGSPRRCYSMSAQIRTDRNAYYDILERAQKGGTDVTEWMMWFLNCLRRAIESANGDLAAVLAKSRFWERYGGTPMNERQIKVLNRLLDGFEGKLTSSKWARLTKSSQDTAHRDITALVDAGILVKGEGGGRSTNYALAGF